MTETAQPDPRPLAHLGAFVMAFGFGLRILVADEPSSTPVTHALPQMLMLAGAAVVLLERVLRGGSSSPWSWLPLLALAFGAFPATGVGLVRVVDAAAAIALGLALRDLVVHDGCGRAVLRLLLAFAVLLATLGITQSLYQREELRDIVAERGLPGFESAEAQAFLASNRASGTLANANGFAGLLLLVLPMAVLGAAAAGDPARRPLAVIALVILVGFACAASAGATLALLLAAGIWWRAAPRPRLATAAFGLGVAGLLVLVVALAGGVELPVVGGKVETFRLRVDYHAVGLRALADGGLFGAGLEAMRELHLAHARPGEAHSAYVHDTWLQLVIELGWIGAALLGAAAFLAWRRRANPSTGDAPRGLSSALFLGGILAAVVAPFLNRSATLLPLTLERPVADGALGAIIVMATLIGSREIARPSTRAWQLGIVAFALHGFVDFALYAPQTMVVLAAVLALAKGRDAPTGTPSRLARPITAAGAFALLAVPWLLAPTILARAEAERHVVPAAAGKRTPEIVDALVRVFTLTPVPADARLVQALSAVASATEPTKVETALDALPTDIRRRPGFRRAEAAHLARRHLVEPEFRSEAERRLQAMLRPDEYVEPWIRLALARVAAQAGDGDTAREHARAGLRALERWELDSAEVASDLRKLVE